jgi:ABC-type uncharacterized transport system permease subunit
MPFDLLFTTLGSATPLLFAVCGGLLSELAGVINFALEGMMLAGAFGAVWGTYVSGSPWIGALVGAFAGMLVGLLHATASLWLRANQIVSSIALNVMAAGVTGMLLHQVFGAYGTSPSVQSLPTLQLPVLVQLTGQAASGISVMALIAWLPVVAAAIFFRHTVLGWRLRACGENPKAARAAGLSVTTIRFSAVCMSGFLAGLGGVSLSIGALCQFVENMIHGRGYLAIAALILGRWRPLGVLYAALLFGFGEALSEQLAVHWSGFPNQIFLAFPYVLCLLVLLVYRGKHQPPSALGKL